jgi:ribosomal-protein-alanine N-acetyltransferase
VIKVNDIYRNLPVLETARLILRKVTMDDLQDVFAYASDDDVTRFLRWGPHKTLEETESYICEVLGEYKAGKDGPWGVEYRQTGRVIGSIHLMAISAQHRKAEIGFALSRSYWRRGLMSEALARVLDYAFGSIGLNRIGAFCLVDNRAGMRFLEKVGMKQEGVLREYVYQKGAFRDFGVYSVLKREYEQRRAARPD